MRTIFLCALLSLLLVVPVSANKKDKKEVRYTWNGPQVYQLEYYSTDKMLVTYMMTDILQPGVWREQISFTMKITRRYDKSIPEIEITDTFWIRPDGKWEQQQLKTFTTIPFVYIAELRKARQLASTHWPKLKVPR